MINKVTTQMQFAMAAFVALAVFVVFICPLTVGPPAPQLQKSLLAGLLALAFSMCSLVAALTDFSAAVFADSIAERQSTPDRLALICTRLC